jgi:hypothetical protein
LENEGNESLEAIPCGDFATKSLEQVRRDPVPAAGFDARRGGIKLQIRTGASNWLRMGAYYLVIATQG